MLVYKDTYGDEDILGTSIEILKLPDKFVIKCVQSGFYPTRFKYMEIQPPILLHETTSEIDEEGMTHQTDIYHVNLCAQEPCNLFRIVEETNSR